MVSFVNLNVGDFYSRNKLADLWGYDGYQAISRGVITPKKTNIVVLFVTMEKQSSLTQYSDYISDDYLYWEGEEKGGSNQRIINSGLNKDSIHLFYRHRHHQDFEYKGLVIMETFVLSEIGPAKFVFKITGSSNPIDLYSLDNYSYGSYIGSTQRLSLQLSRIGHGEFRINLLNLWKGCAITGVAFPEILRASHIKPWKNSDNLDRLNPYNGFLLSPKYDALFDKGFISFADNGAMLISKQVETYSNVLHLSTDMKLRKIYSKNLPFLEYHRDVLFNK